VKPTSLEDDVKSSSWIRPKVLGFLAALAVVSPGYAAAQSRLTVDARGGVAVPASDLADLFDVGPSFGAGLAYRLTPRVSLRLDGDVDILNGASGPGGDGPDMNIYHYNAGVAVKLIGANTQGLNVDVNVGAGASTFNSDSFQVNGTVRDFSETYFTTNGGVRVGYDVSRSLNVFVGGQAYLMVTDDADTAVFAQINPAADPNGFDTAWTFPVTAGVALRL